MPSDQIQELLAKRRDLMRQLMKLDAELEKALPVQDQRATAVRSLRGTVTYCGDVVSPIDTQWDVER